MGLWTLLWQILRRPPRIAEPHVCTFEWFGTIYSPAGDLTLRLCRGCRLVEPSPAAVFDQCAPAFVDALRGALARQGWRLTRGWERVP